MEWRPIETAPKNGTPVLIAGHWGGVPDAPQFVDVDTWDDHSGDWRCHDRAHDLVTHWLPLPAPPICDKPLGANVDSGAVR